MVDSVLSQEHQVLSLFLYVQWWETQYLTKQTIPSVNSSTYWKALPSVEQLVVSLY